MILVFTDFGESLSPVVRRLADKDFRCCCDNSMIGYHWYNGWFILYFIPSSLFSFVQHALSNFTLYKLCMFTVPNSKNPYLLEINQEKQVCKLQHYFATDITSSNCATTAPALALTVIIFTGNSSRNFLFLSTTSFNTSFLLCNATTFAYCIQYIYMRIA